MCYNCISVQLQISLGSKPHTIDKHGDKPLPILCTQICGIGFLQQIKDLLSRNVKISHVQLSKCYI